MEHILVVEDEQYIREAIKDILELAGYQVSEASDGLKGFESITKQSPDLVLCDVNMPKMDGFELLGAINQHMKDEIIPPFLFLTARVERNDIRHGLSMGADDYILKPFDHKELLDIIRLRLDKRKKLLSTGAYTDPAEEIVHSFNKLALPSDNGLEMIEFEDIVKCQAERAYCRFHLINGKKILVSKPLKEFEGILLSRQFLRVHKSTIVNTSYIQRYVKGKGGYLVLKDGSHANVSVRRKEELMRVIRQK